MLDKGTGSIGSADSLRPGVINHASPNPSPRQTGAVFRRVPTWRTYPPNHLYRQVLGLPERDRIWAIFSREAGKVIGQRLGMNFIIRRLQIAEDPDQ